jgi:DNA polymerase III delta prime subunit
MPFSDFHGNSETVHRLRDMLARKRFPHAVILSGARNSGKYTLALMLTQVLNCLAPTQTEGLPDFCGQCANCRRIALAADLDARVREATEARVGALVYVGDCMEENAGTIAELAGQIRLLGMPAFMFQEGDDPAAQRTFKQMAQLTKGAYARFDSASAQTLRELLMGAAVYAAGGHKALAEFAKRTGGDVALLTHQLR